MGPENTVLVCTHRVVCARERHDLTSLAQAAAGCAETCERFGPKRSGAANPNCRASARKFEAAALGDGSASRKDEVRRGIAEQQALDQVGISITLRQLPLFTVSNTGSRVGGSQSFDLSLRK
jgi:hypothetical protein